MTTASKKAKGRTFQYFIAEKIADLFNIKFDSKDDTCIIKSRLSSQTGTDVYFTDNKMYEKFPFDIECKNCESPSIKSWIKQAKSNTKEGRNFLLFWKSKDFKKSIVIMDTDKFFEIIKQNLNK